ncbi:hypothetical protein C1893_02925 [Pseudomonas sp. MPR-ANC1]|nr:hypothetical protein C1893_02925 [Pseudomonas sp. MPR-ANC1]
MKSRCCDFYWAVRKLWGDAISATLTDLVGARLLAKAVVHSALMVTDTPLSRAGSLLQGDFWCYWAAV